MQKIINYKQDAGELSKNISSYFRFLSTTGCRGIDCSKKTVEIIKSWDLQNTHLQLLACRKCLLARNRKRVICGQGNPQAKLMFIGSAPESEDGRTGIPYSGKAGELLTKIIAAMNLDRESVYITHVVKCCAHEKQKIVKENINLCKSYLLAEIEIIKPKIVCTLGDEATQAILGIPLPIRRIRGRFQAFKGIQVMPTFAPEYLLEHPGEKRAVWEDIQQVMKVYNSI